MRRLQEIPPEVLTHTLLTFLPHNSVILLRLLCSDFDHYVWEYWKCSKTSYLIHFRTFDQHFDRIARIYLSKLPNLRSIILQNVKEANERFYELDGDVLINGLSILNNIEYLDCSKMVKLKRTFVEDLAQKENITNTLKELILPHVWENQLSFDFSPFQKLERLTFENESNSDFLDSVATVKSLKLPPSLKYFKYDFCAPLTALSECKNLNELIANNLSVGDAVKLSENNNLTTFKVKGHKRYSTHHEWIWRLANVKSLGFLYSSAYKLKHLQSLKYLEELNIDFSGENLGSLDLYNSLSALTNLKSISLSFDMDELTSNRNSPTNVISPFSKLHTLVINNGDINLISLLAGPSLKNLSITYDSNPFIDSNSFHFLKNCLLLEDLFFDAPFSLSGLFQVFNELKKHHFRVLKGNTIDAKVIDLCPNKQDVQELYISFAQTELDLREFKQLRKLRLSESDANLKLDLPNSVSHVEIEGYLSLYSLKQISRLPFLTSLKLSMDELTDDELIQMIQAMDDSPPLTSLIIRYSEHLTNSVISHIDNKLVNLRIALIDDCPNIRDSGEITLLEYEKRFVFSTIYSEFEQPEVLRLRMFAKGNFDQLVLEDTGKINDIIDLYKSEGKLSELYFTLLEFIDRGYLENVDEPTKWNVYKHCIRTYIQEIETSHDTQTIDKIIEQVTERDFMVGRKADILNCISKNLHRFQARFCTVGKILLSNGQYEQVLALFPFTRSNDANICTKIMKLFLSGSLNLLDYYDFCSIEKLIDYFCEVQRSKEHFKLLKSFFELVMKTILSKTMFSFPSVNEKSRLVSLQLKVQDYIGINYDFMENYLESVKHIPSQIYSTDELIRLSYPTFYGSEYFNIPPNDTETNFSLGGHTWILSIRGAKFSLRLSKPKSETGKLFESIKIHCCVISPDSMETYHVFIYEFNCHSSYVHKHDTDFSTKSLILCMKIIETKYYQKEEIDYLLEGRIIEPQLKQLANKSPWLARNIHKNRLVQYKTVQVITSTDLSDHAFASQELDIFGSNHILYIRQCVEGKFCIEFGTYLSSAPHLKLTYLLANETMDEESIAISKINKPLYQSNDLNLFSSQTSVLRGKSDLFEQGIYKPKIIIKENGNTYFQFTVHLVVVLKDSLVGCDKLPEIMYNHDPLEYSWENHTDSEDYDVEFEDVDEDDEFEDDD